MLKQIGSHCEGLYKHSRYRMKSWLRLHGRAASFAAVLMLFLTVGMTFGGRRLQRKRDALVPSPTLEITSAVNRSLTAASPVRAGFLAGPSVLWKNTGSTGRTSFLKGYSQGSLAFEANQGQTDSKVKFLSRGVGYALFFTAEEAVVTLRGVASGVGGYADKPLTPSAASDTHSGAVLRMRFVGANGAPRISGSEQLPGKVNYFVGNDRKQWRSDIPTYAQVRYEDIYPGVGVIYYGTQGRLEYDLSIAPGTDPRIIALDFVGANETKIDAQGDLRLLMAGGEVVLAKPRIYQTTVEGQKTISGAYVLKADRHIGVQVGEYDRSQPLIIDPVLSYSTYLGGSGYDAGTAIAVDGAGNAYITGFTRSSNFPVTAGSFQTS